MNCDLIIEDLQAFLDNELQSTRLGEVQTHLQTCKDCSQMINELKDLSSLMKSCDIPIPNLPTGQELLAKVASQSTKKQTNLFTNFLLSTYEFFFKYKAPVLATVTAATLIVVAFNISGVKEGRITFYSEQEKSSATAIQEKSLNQDLAKTAPSVAPAAEAPIMENNIENNTIATKAPTTSEPLAKPQIVSTGEEEGVLGGTVSNLDSGGIVGGVLGGVTKDDQPSPPPPPPPSDTPKAITSSKVEMKPSESKEQDDLAKNNLADKKVLAEQEAKNALNESNTNEAVEITAKEDSRGKSRDLTVQPTQSKTETGREKSGARPGVSIQKTEKADTNKSSSNLGMPAPASMAQPRRAELPAKVAEKVEPETRQQPKHTEITVSAKDLQSVKTQLAQIAEAQKGDITLRITDNKITSILIKVPTSNLENTLVAVRKVGKVIKENTRQRSVLVDELAKERKDTDKIKSKRSGEKKQLDVNFSTINIVFIE